MAVFADVDSDLATERGEKMKGVQILNYDLSHEYCNGFMRVCAKQTFFFFLISQGKGGGVCFGLSFTCIVIMVNYFLVGTGLGLHVTSCDAHHDFVTSRWRAMISWGSLSCLAVRSLL